jgi:hypothetical protein
LQMLLSQLTTKLLRSRDGSVSIVTMLRAEQTRYYGLIRDVTASGPALGHNLTSVLWMPRLFPGGKVAGA